MQQNVSLEASSLYEEGGMEDTPICWICLDAASADSELVRPCRCPRYCHALCIARWQLQSAGSRKEKHCEFCGQQLPDWKHVLTPPCGCTAPAIMNVNFNGRTYSFEVKPGVDGYRCFTEAIRKSFELPSDSELNITFTCDEPNTAATGSLLTLHGSGAYDAAVHCASVSAARRLATTPGSTSIGPHSCDSSRAMTTTGSSGEEDGSGSGSSVSYTSCPKNRRLAGLGKKLRAALTELLAMK